MIVVDTNILVSMTFPAPHSAAVHALHERDSAWEAPQLWRGEFLNVLAAYYRKRLIDYQEAASALHFAERLIGSREHLVDPMAVIEVMVNTRCSSYDCEYIALAKQLRTSVITYDQALIDQFPGLALTPEKFLEK